jgi:hypothetical protein
MHGRVIVGVAGGGRMRARELYTAGGTNVLERRPEDLGITEHVLSEGTAGVKDR